MFYEYNAGFGGGEVRDETTRGCLLALARLAKTRRFKKPLDIGTGTGIRESSRATFTNGIVSKVIGPVCSAMTCDQ